MADHEPTSAQAMTPAAAAPTEWGRALALLNDSQATYWLSTVRPVTAFGFGTDETLTPTRWRFYARAG